MVDSERIGSGRSLHLFTVRETLVAVDRDLAAFYGTRTAALNQQVKRNPARFPEDFTFRLTREEWKRLERERDEPVRRGGHGYVPRVFTEQGVGMLASVLRGRKATQLSIEVLRAFVRARETPTATRDESSPRARALFDGVVDAVMMSELDRPFTTATPITYFLQAENDGPIKIGMTHNLPARLRSIQMMSPVPLRLLGVVPGDIEAECHCVLGVWRIHGEWFQAAKPVLDLIRQRCVAKSADLQC